MTRQDTAEHYESVLADFQASVLNLPPAEPTVLQLAGLAMSADKRATEAVRKPEEYHSIEVAAIDAADTFWSALEAETGLTRDIIERLI